jgi:predicted restriction endonuclease
MESSIEIIYNVIKTEYEKNKNIKSIEEIITNEYINGLLDTYDNNKVIYCLKTLQNIGIDFEILDEDIEYNIEDHLEDEDNVEEEEEDVKKEDNLKTSIARDDAEFRASVKSRFQTCIICESAMCVPACCQVAHIWDFAKCNESSKYNPDNGLLMCANWHLLFDANLMRLEPVLGAQGMVKIILASNLKTSALYKYHNKIITILPENIPFLEKRYNDSS